MPRKPFPRFQKGGPPGQWVYYLQAGVEVARIETRQSGRGRPWYTSYIGRDVKSHYALREAKAHVREEVARRTGRED